MTRQDMAAGAHAPAAAVPGWIDWEERADPPLYRVAIWPNRSMGPRGQGRVMGIAAAGFSMPLVAAAGTTAFWGLLPFCAAALGVLHLAFRRRNSDAMLVEEFQLWPDEVRVERREPGGRVLRWRAVPQFLRLTIHRRARIRNYLTLSGGGREIELGAFLGVDERLALKQEIDGALARLR